MTHKNDGHFLVFVPHRLHNQYLSYVSPTCAHTPLGSTGLYLSKHNSVKNVVCLSSKLSKKKKSETLRVRCV